MKKSTIPAIALTAILCACPILQSCSETPSGSSVVVVVAVVVCAGVSPGALVVVFIVGSTAHAAGTIIAAPFRLVGDALSIVF